MNLNAICLLKDNQRDFLVYNESLNSAKYPRILRSVVNDFFENLPLEHYALVGFNLIKHRYNDMTRFELFYDRWFRHLQPCNWPERLLDFMPLEFYLCGNMQKTQSEVHSIQYTQYSKTAPTCDLLLRSAINISNRIEIFWIEAFVVSSVGEEWIEKNCQETPTQGYNASTAPYWNTLFSVKWHSAIPFPFSLSASYIEGVHDHSVDVQVFSIIVDVYDNHYSTNHRYFPW